MEPRSLIYIDKEVKEHMPPGFECPLRESMKKHRDMGRKSVDVIMFCVPGQTSVPGLLS
jgi:hypothetical protein